MTDRTNIRSRMEEYAPDEHQDEQDQITNNINAQLTSEDQKRQDFIHRMNQVYVGGHQADLTNDASESRHSSSSAGNNNNNNNNTNKKRSTSRDTNDNENNDNDDNENDNGHKNTTTDTTTTTSKPNSKELNNNSIADSNSTSSKNYKPSLPSSSTTNPKPTSATSTSASKINNMSSSSSSAMMKKQQQQLQQQHSSSSKMHPEKMNRYTAQGFPKYPNNPVLTAVSVPPSDQFPLKDARIGPQHFSRLKLLGRGGIGQVFLVRLKDTDKLYAMKVLTKEEMILRNKIKRVMTEREILATANHPFIVTMYASFQTSDRLCFVMEYCEGGEFFRVLQKQPKKRLKEEAVKFYAAEVILALEYLHHMGFIYRDLKPENILMRASGHIALTDFDLSKQAHAVSPRVIQQQLSISDKIRKTLSIKRNNSSLNNLEIVNSEPVLPYQTNSFVGTEEYIAPEVVNGVGQSSAVDWWTLGILIYEMLTGTTPFKGSHTDETFNNIVNEQLKWPDDITISNECKQLVKKLLRREADKRLGAENGASDIKRSKWFKDFNLALIRNETPPIIPSTDTKDLKSPPSSGERDASRSQNQTMNSTDVNNPYIDDNDPENPFVNFNMRRNQSLQRKY